MTNVVAIPSLRGRDWGGGAETSETPTQTISRPLSIFSTLQSNSSCVSFSTLIHHQHIRHISGVVHY